MYKKLQSPLLSQEIVNLGSIAMTGMMAPPPRTPVITQRSSPPLSSKARETARAERPNLAL